MKILKAKKIEKPLPSISLNEWLEAERQLDSHKEDPIPPGAVNSQQYAELRGLSVGYSHLCLMKLVRAGLAGRIKLRRIGKCGKVYKMTFFRLLNKAKASNPS